MPDRQPLFPSAGVMLAPSSFQRIATPQHGTTLPSARVRSSLARMIRTRLAVGVTLICAMAGGCRNGRAPSLGMADTTFVGTLSELRRIETDTALDVTMRDSTRRMVLRRHKVSSVQLEHAARVLAETPARASDLWRQIETVPRPAVPTPSTIQGAAPSNNHPVPRP